MRNVKEKGNDMITWRCMIMSRIDEETPGNRKVNGYVYFPFHTRQTGQTRIGGRG
jgi:hypothetical protein